MAEIGIARVRTFVASVYVGTKGFIIGATATFALGLEVILIGGVIFASPGAVVQFMAGYSLILLLVEMSCVAGIVFFIWRVYSYPNDYWSLPVVPRMKTDKSHFHIHMNLWHDDAAVPRKSPFEKQSTFFKGLGL